MSVQIIADQMELAEDSVRKKCERLGLEEEDAKGLRTSSSIKLPKDLPSVETALRKVLT